MTYNQDYAKISTHTPHARRDIFQNIFHFKSADISTHTPHARRDPKRAKGQYTTLISTHTPHARRDEEKLELLRDLENFYSHASCEA